MKAFKKCLFVTVVCVAFAVFVVLAGGLLYDRKNDKEMEQDFMTLAGKNDEKPDYLQDADLVEELSDFIGYFTKIPVLDTFTQEENAPVMQFAAYKMAYERDGRMNYDQQEKRYSVTMVDLENYISEYFYLEGAPSYPSDVYLGREKVTILETFQPQGGLPIIDSIEKKEDHYFIGGHIAGMETAVSQIEYGQEASEGGPVIRGFLAELLRKEDGTLRMYEFTRSLSVSSY